MIKILSLKAFKELENRLNKLDDSLQSSYAREDWWRGRYRKIKKELGEDLLHEDLLNKEYSKQNRILQEKILDLKNQLYQQILLNNILNK